jgi:uncharacterized membrane protein
MARTQKRKPPTAIARTSDFSQPLELSAPLREFRRTYRRTYRRAADDDRPQLYRNVSDGERIASAAAGSILALLGLGRRNLSGAVIAGIGGALVYRGATGRCPVYSTLGVSTAEAGRAGQGASRGIHITQSYLVNKPPAELYTFWRNFENLPSFMTHLESVATIDERRSRWVAKAPRLYGGQVEWDAEVTEDLPDRRIVWRSLPGSEVEHDGSVRFESALGDRGTRVSVELQYRPPGGQVGRYLAKLFGEEPESQIRDDLRNFKRIMEVGEIPTTAGQPRGTCLG